jgi:glycosyltransferase involved in cell wall biosynthesis
VEWLIINDGSVDNTVEVAKANGVTVVSFTKNQGWRAALWRVWMRALSLAQM